MYVLYILHITCVYENVLFAFASVSNIKVSEKNLLTYHSKISLFTRFSPHILNKFFQILCKQGLLVSRTITKYNNLKKTL